MTVRVRDACEADLDSLVSLYNRYIIETPITFDLVPYTVQQRRDSWFCHYSNFGCYRLLVAEYANLDAAAQVVGYASSSKFAAKDAYNTSVETSIYIAPEYVGLGIGGQLYEALFATLANEDVHRAYAGITLPNEASIAVHKKFGFEQVGLFKEVGRKFDRYWDVAWYEKTIKKMSR
ncbi:MAG: N-acetyltransferase family protein [Cyanobacteria bacterium J06555_13]